MSRRKVELGSAFILVSFLIFGCASVNYIGHSFDPTTSIDTYFSENEITQEYEIIGHAIGSGVWASSDVIQTKLIEEAKYKGADAILITGMARSNVATGHHSSTPEFQIMASFIIYK